MQKLLYILTVLFLSVNAAAQTPAAYSSDDLMKRISNQDTLYIVNFWATWCGPCVKELPEFDKIQQAYNDKPIKILLVSLDFKNAYPKRLSTFIRKKKLQHEVVWFNETNANSFIPKIEPRWQGSIPATMIMFAKKEYQNFYEGTVTAEQLKMIIDRQLTL